jgi:16S rRNA (adenine1518-N6/adenine1519-N6)-dimethyltransferase
VSKQLPKKQPKEGLIAKKRFGQNFLVNNQIQIKVINAFAQLLEQYQSKHILEIGPGRGDLTRHLIDFDLPLTCLEIDQEVINFISANDLISSKINLLNLDALEVLKTANNSQLPSNFILFSSLPYNVGSRILVELGLNYHQTPFCVILQKEVAKKTVLKSGKSTLFGIWLNLYWDCKVMFDIPAGNFNPKPKVTSSVLVGRPKENLPGYLKTSEGRKKTLALLQKILHQPKKTLVNNLRALNWSREEIADFCHNFGYDDKTRITNGNYYSILNNLWQSKLS